jgi:hypothetical protein
MLAWHVNFVSLSAMKTTFPWKQTLVLFAAVLLAYLFVFYGIEWVRHRKGPWQVEFTATLEEGHPILIITQAFQGVFTILEFPDEKVKVGCETVTFDRPKKAKPPFGKVIYEDLTILPGVVTFDLFGHEVELLPRALIVNKKEFHWRETGALQVWSTNKPPAPPKPVKDYE